VIKKFNGYIPIILVILLVVLSFFVVRPFLEAILLGALLAYFTYPLYKFLARKIPITFSSLLVCLIVLLLMVVPTFFLVKFLLQQSYTAFVVVKERFSAGIFANCTNLFCGKMEHLLQLPSISSQIQNITSSLNSKIVQLGSDLLFSLPSLILNLFVMFFAMFYFLQHGAQLLAKLNHYLSMQKKEYSYIIFRLKDIVHGIVYGYLMVAGIQGALGALGFFLFGVSSPLFWGVMMALLALIPVLGTGFVWVPASALFLIDGITQNSNFLIFKGVGLFLYGLLIISTIDNILKPKLIGEKAKIHPLIILVGVFGGLLFFGPLGIFIGPLVLSITYVIVETYLGKK